MDTFKKNSLINKIFFLIFMCHRIPERSFFLGKKQFPMCARCTGIFFGYLIAIVMLILNIEINIFIVVFLFLPIAIDGLGQYFKYFISNNNRRFLTGIIGGIAMIYSIKAVSIFGYSLGKFINSMF